MSEKRLLDYFAVVGLEKHLKLSKGDEEQEKHLTKVELMKENEGGPFPPPGANQKMLDLSGTGNIYLRATFGGQEESITNLNFYRIKYNARTKEMIKPFKNDIEPIPIHTLRAPHDFKRQIKYLGRSKQKVISYKGNFDMTELLEAEENSGTFLCLCTSCSKNNFPITDVIIKQNEKNENNEFVFKVPTSYKYLLFRLGKGNKDRLICYKYLNPVEKVYKPELVNRFPFTDRNYNPFPPALPLFCFPNGISLMREQTTPTSFSFIMTQQTGERLFGTCLIFHESPNEVIKEELRSMNFWETESVYVPKAICVVSRYSFSLQYKEILKQLYRLHLSLSPIPLERIITNFMEEIPIPSKGEVQVDYDLASMSVSFYRPLDQFPPFATKEDLEYLFRALTIDNAVSVFLALLLEKKIILRSAYKALISHATVALSSLLYPLAWNGVLVPILPESMKGCLEAPVPYVIGIETSSIERSELPLEAYIVNLDENLVQEPAEPSEPMPKLPIKDIKALTTKLYLLCGDTFQRPDPFIPASDEAFNVVVCDPDEIKAFDEIAVRDTFFDFVTRIIRNYTKYLSPPKEKKVIHDFKDAFNVRAFLSNRDSTKPSSFLYKLCETSLFAHFIEGQSFGGQNYQELRHFTELFKIKRTKKIPYILCMHTPNKFFKAFPPNAHQIEPGITYQYDSFPHLIKENFIAPRPIENFDKENHVLVLNTLKKEEEEIRVKKMKDIEWCKYLVECLYEVWFTVFSASLPFYPPQYAREMVKYARNVLHLLKKKYKCNKRIEIIYRKMIAACGLADLCEDAVQMFNDMKTEGIEPDVETINLYFQSCSTENQFRRDSGMRLYEEEKEEEEKVGIRLSNASHSTSESSTTGHNPFMTDTPLQLEKYRKKMAAILEQGVIEFPEICPQEECPKILREEEVMAGFQKGLNSYTVTCPNCKIPFVPQLEISFPAGRGKPNKVKSLYLLSPALFYKEVQNLLDQNQAHLFFQYKFWKEHQLVFWNMLLYFRLISMPYFMLDLNFKRDHIAHMIKTLRTPVLLQDKRPTHDSKIVNLDIKRQEVANFPKPPRGRSASNMGGHLRPPRESSLGGDSGRFTPKSVGIDDKPMLKTESNYTAGSDFDKLEKLAMPSAAKITKFFGLMLEEFRRRKVDLKCDLFGPLVHVPFNEAMLKSLPNDLPHLKEKQESDMPLIKISAPGLDFHSNQRANQIIEGSLASNRSGSGNLGNGSSVISGESGNMSPQRVPDRNFLVDIEHKKHTSNYSFGNSLGVGANKSRIPIMSKPPIPPKKF